MVVELETTTCASVAKVALPRATALTGTGAWTILSQERQLYLGRTLRTTRQRTGTMSSIRVRPSRAGATRRHSPGSAGTRCRLMDDVLAWQMCGQTADGHRPNRHAAVGHLSPRRVALRLQFLQRQFELLDLAAELFGRGTELHPPQPGDLSAQGIDEQIAGGERGIGRASKASSAAIRAVASAGETGASDTLSS